MKKAASADFFSNLLGEGSLLYPDGHVHSSLSFDGVHSVLEMAQAAADRGFKEVAITDHLEFYPESKAFDAYDYARARETVEDARVLLGGRIRVLFGVELGFDHRRESEIRAFLKEHPFDLVLGAVHGVEGRDVGAPLFEGREPGEAYRLYFREALAAVQSGLFDAFAHLDLPKRYGISYFGRAWDPEPFRDEMTAIFKAMIETEVCLEVNTSGLRQDPREPFPGLEALEWYRSLGGRLVSLGSDAHRLWDLGFGFREIGSWLRKTGLEPAESLASVLPRLK